MKKVVVPGELITGERKKVGSHVYVSEGKIYSDVLGLTDDEREVASVVPLEGPYVAQQTDLIVGVVVSETFGSYAININSSHLAYIPKSQMREELKVEDIISAKVMEVNEVGSAELGNVRVFYGGELIDVAAVKVPRIIGKNGSMLDVLKQGTGSTVLVGRNGWIWAKGGNTILLIKALDKIQREAHTEHLTKNMEAFLKEESKKGETKIEEEPKPLKQPAELKRAATVESDTETIEESMEE